MNYLQIPLVTVHHLSNCSRKSAVLNANIPMNSTKPKECRKAEWAACKDPVRVVSRLPPNFVSHQRLSSTKCRLPLKVIFNQRSSSTGGRLQPKSVFPWRLSSTYHKTLIDLIFVRTVNIPNLSLLPCLEVP